MKKVLTLVALAVFTASFAQENKNKKQETVITKTVVKAADGKDVSVKAVTHTKKQTIALADADAHQVNQSVVMKPKVVNTEVTYGYDGDRFQFLSQKDNDGYRLMTVKDNATQEEYAIIKPLSQNGYYIMSQAGVSSFGYFNAEGNFVVEQYDPKIDAVVLKIYKLELKNDTPEKDKM